MTATLQDELLVKAAHNITRVEEFFVARRGWSATPDGVAALRSLHAALSHALGEAVRPLLERHRLTEPQGEPEWGVAPLPPNELEAERVQRFGVFVQQLGDWFMTLPEEQVSARGRELLSAVAGALAGTASAVEQVLAAHGVVVPSLQPEEPPDPAPPDPPPATVSPEAVMPPARTAGDENKVRLVLDDTEGTPVLQTFQGVVELTCDTQQALSELLEQGGITYDSYQRHKFERKVLQWVQATPQGSVLVIQIGDLTGQLEPYPTYAVKT
jgi:hypothetical protein